MATIKFDYEDAAGDGLDGLDGLAGGGDAGTYCYPCENPNIIPIYPVRIAWGDLEGDVNAGFAYPTSLAPFTQPSSATATKGFALRRVREGMIMIFDPAGQVWSAFTPLFDDSATGGRFQRQVLNQQTNKWEFRSEAPVRIPFVPDTAETIYICYVEHAWSQGTMMRAHANTDGFRDKVMTKVRLSAPGDSTFSAPLSTLATKVEEFAPDGLVHRRRVWDLLGDIGMPQITPESILASPEVRNARHPGVLVALHDPGGVAGEIAMCHMNRVAVKNEYLELNAYPVASAKAAITMQKAGFRRMAEDRDLTRAQKRMFTGWQTAVSPLKDSYLSEVETTVEGYDTALTQVLAAWQKFFEMGKAAPNNTPGSLQTHLLHYHKDPALQRDEEVIAAQRFAQRAIASISASQAGAKKAQEVVFSAANWNADTNPVAAALKLTISVAEAGGALIEQLRGRVDAAATLMSDMALPASYEITRLIRQELLHEINRFSNGMVQRQMTMISVPASDAIAETAGRGPRATQSTQRIARGHTLHRVQTPVGVYTFDGTIHVASQTGQNLFSQAALGFAVFANTLNIISLLEQKEKNPMSGAIGRVTSDPYLVLVLTGLETMTKTFQGIEAAMNAPTTGARSYFIRGRLTRADLARLVRGTDVGDDFLRTMVNRGAITEAGRIPTQTSRLSTWIGRLGTAAGIALAALDLFNALEARRRGDRMAMYSNAALGVGALFLACGALTLQLGGWAVVGAVIGLILIVIGIALSFFVDDPVTRWLKNSFWGTSPDYLYWDDADRDDLMAQYRAGDIYEAQRKAIADGTLDISRFFQREMQEHHEMLYWPQRETPPDGLYATEERGFWIFKTTTRMFKKEVEGAGIAFRLPNHVDGYSSFSGRFLAFAEVRGVNTRSHGFKMFDVTDQVNESLKYLGDGKFEAHFQVRMMENMDRNVVNDLEWTIKTVVISRGWLYEPAAELILPRNYSDFWFEKGWKEDAPGGQKSIQLLGSS